MDVIALAYHGVSDSWPAETTVAPERLEAQLSYVARQGYRGATFADALTTPAPRTVAVTFDDAHRSVLELALPIMSRLGLPGTIFVPTAYAEDARLMDWQGIAQWLGGPHESELRCMGWDELRSLADAGWEIGSHSHTHPRLTTLDDEALARELRESREACEDRLGRKCRSLAYPYSDFDDRVARAARESGYHFAATIPREVPPPLPLQWPRLGVYNHNSDRRFQMRVSQLGIVRGSAPFRLAKRARAAVRRARG